MILFSGTSNLPLAQKISPKLGAVEITRFIDSECRVFVKEEVKDQEVYVLQSLSEVADQNLIELCLLGSALKDLGAKKITAIIPWMGYSKQDKAFRKGEAVSAQLVAKFIEAAGFDAVITCELHSENVTPYFHIPVTEVSTHVLFPMHKDVTVVSPDRGGKSRSERFAKNINAPVVYLEKQRDYQTGMVSITGITGEVNDKNIIIFDDIINTGETAIKTSDFVKHRGAKSVTFFATHAVLAGKISLEESKIDTVIVTDTIFIPEHKKFRKLEIVTVAPLLKKILS